MTFKSKQSRHENINKAKIKKGENPHYIFAYNQPVTINSGMERFGGSAPERIKRRKKS